MTVTTLEPPSCDAFGGPLRLREVGTDGDHGQSFCSESCALRMRNVPANYRQEYR